jgi:hypothetical protein
MVACWLVSVYLLSGSPLAPSREQLGYAFEIVSSAAALAGAVLAFDIVGDVQSRQHQRAQRLEIDLATGYRPIPAVVQPRVDQPRVEGYPAPPSVPPVATRAGDTTPWWPTT